MALRVGLTGGVASGKSLVARDFAALGVPVIDADQVYREAVAPGTPLLAQVLERFGPQVLRRYGVPLQRDDGSLDRAVLRRLVFEDAAERRALEALTHPAVRAQTEVLAQQAGGPYQIHVIPLLVETHSQARFGRILVVDCPEALQIERLQARDGITPELARSMLAAQATRAQRLAAADDVILNDAGPQALGSKINALDQKYRQLAGADPV
ncbi:MAG TPA: dephospho-CoA kinase [Steroidobacteraceae bacterium]|jgi:dephospho-CoA kinase|nr:dephospho-CoA kinase [Steroidobacteraceae bacterium]